MVGLRHDWSVRTRTTLLSGVVIGVLCLGFCGLILMEVHRHAIRERADRILMADLRVARLLVRDELPRLIRDRTITALQVVDAQGRIVATNERMIGKPRIAYFIPPKEGTRADQVICSPPGFPGTCMIVVAVRISVRGNEWIAYGADPTIPWYVNGWLLVRLLGASTLLTAAAALGAYRTVSRTLARVQDVVIELAEITATDLGRRVPVSERRDEIRGLTDAVNETLDRLEAAVERQRRFASDASHDLRSPITAMRLQVEEAQLHPDETNWPKTAGALESSLDRLQAIVTDLLALARLDSGTKGVTERLDLSELVASELGRRIPQVRIVSNIKPAVVVSGDRLQFIRLLTNLVDNAERHATSTVLVLVRREGDEAVLEVSDDGPGIPPDQRKMVFERFTRLDTARNKEAGGTGLGLPIARQIAEQHGGSLIIEDSRRGARFVLRIPIHEPELRS
jgi:signal transduction histidine kinase